MLCLCGMTFFCSQEKNRSFLHAQINSVQGHEPLMQCLREIGVDGKDIKIIRNLYWDQTASVRIMSELSDDI